MTFKWQNFIDNLYKFWSELYCNFNSDLPKLDRYFNLITDGFEKYFLKFYQKFMAIPVIFHGNFKVITDDFYSYSSRYFC